MSTTFRRQKWLTVPGALLFCFGAAYAFVPQEFWWDWDMQRYTVEVQIARQGDGQFSFAHNLLKSWLYQAANVLAPVLHDFQALQGARWLTILFSGCTALLLFLSVRSITRSGAAALTASALWFAIPGNSTLISSLEDNTWANAFNAAFLFLTLKLAGYSRPRVDEPIRLIVLGTIAGAVLSVGINIHQQLVIDFYAFFILLLFSYERRGAAVAYMSAAFVAGYLGGSIVQNHLAFGQPELWNSVRRLYHDAYKGSFPSLYFFTSGQSIGEWSSRIILGWKRTFLFDARYPPFWAPLCLAAFTGLLAVVAESRRKGTFFFLFRGRLLVFLAVTTLIHVPHSLLYEPENIERWDSTLPGLIILLAVATYFAVRGFAHKRTAATAMAVASAAAVFFSLGQTWHFFSTTTANYVRHPAVLGLNSVVEYLSDQPDTTARHVVVLDSLYTSSDIQTRLTYRFPDVTVITVENGLRVLYSSPYLQHRSPFNGSRFPEIDFPANSHFSVTPVVYAELNARLPEFIPSHAVQVIPLVALAAGERD